MQRYSFTLYSGQKFVSYSDTDSRVRYPEDKYIQILGAAKGTIKNMWIIPFLHLNEIKDLDQCRGYKLYIVDRKGNSRPMASPIKKVERESL